MENRRSPRTRGILFFDSQDDMRWTPPMSISRWALRNQSPVHLCGSNLNSQSRFGVGSMIRPIPSTGIDPSVYRSAQTSQNGSPDNSRCRSLAVHRGRRRHKNSMKGPDSKVIKCGLLIHLPLHQIDKPEVSQPISPSDFTRSANKAYESDPSSVLDSDGPQGSQMPERPLS